MSREAFGVRGACSRFRTPQAIRKRQQAGRTPNASRSRGIGSKIILHFHLLNLEAIDCSHLRRGRPFARTTPPSTTDTGWPPASGHPLWKSKICLASESAFDTVRGVPLRSGFQVIERSPG